MSETSEACEGTYEYECMRAELLGLERPDYEEYLRSHPQNPVVEGEQAVKEVLEGVKAQDEGLENVSAGLSELNTILTVTQKKLNRFKATCGSLTNLLKIRVGQGSTESLGKEGARRPQNGDGDEEEARPENVSALDKLDAMLDAADRAEVSMTQQNKQMKRFLR